MSPSARYWMYAASTITEPNLDNETWQKWYQEAHIPDILKTGSVHRALLYRAASENNPKQWLAVYDCYDLDFMQPHRFKDIPQKHAYLGHEKTSMDVADFDVRQYHLISDFNPMMSEASPLPTLLAVSVDSTKEGSGENALQQSKATEHAALLCGLPHYTRSRWYELRYSNKTAPSHLIAHELDDANASSSQQFSDVPETEVSKKVQATVADAHVWRLVSCHRP